ncbi:MAG: hypothetical protein S4CHLAM7_05000 [Chlamydiae bacterium]|nr:hypothetical protein [Chlamydiota bacterium]
MIVLEDKLKDGQMKMVFVNVQGNGLAGTGVPPPLTPEQIRNQLAHQMMKTEMDDLISTIKEIGSTDGKGGSQNAGGSSSSIGNGENAATKAAKQAEANAQKKESAAAAAAKKADAAEKAAAGKGPQAEAAAKKAAEAAHQNLKDAKQELANAKAALQKAEENDPSTPAGKMHDLIWNHNVFWALLQVAMEGNSSIFGILTNALGKVANLLEGNQYVTGIITQINNDLQQLVSLSKNGANLTPQQKQTEINLIKDLKAQLQLLQNIISPPKGDTPADKKAQEAHNSLGPDLLKQLKTLTGDYTSEGNTDGGSTPGDATGFAKMLTQMQSGDFSGFNKFWSNMVNESGKSSPGSGPTGIYSQTSSFETSLNTSGSKFMAQQNLDTKQVDEIEKLWTSGITTDKSMLQSVLGNLAN